MHRRQVLAALGTAVATVGPGCAGVGSAGSVDGDIGMTAVAFEPTTFTVEAGDDVVWYNNSARAHSVTAYGDALPADAAYFATGGYDTEAAAREAWEGMNGALTSGQTYSHTFEVPGTYGYFCIPHEQAGMVGEIVVEE
jgi:plastocyanin